MRLGLVRGHARDPLELLQLGVLRLLQLLLQLFRVRLPVGDALLAARGFAPESIEAVMDGVAADEGLELG
ncbi:MAG: hypothetical protein E6G25_00185 [Actinobacteria bacterium]|nr:MAG: hypothetical protein E6G25_00185 [Actinomycetota bacterium]